MKKIRTFAKNKALIEERRNQILHGAAKLFLKKGYGGTSMRELVDYLGISKMGLYHYIGTKEDIIHLIIDYSSKYEHNLVKQISEDTNATQSLKDAMKLYMTGVEENQDIHLVINHVAASMPKEIRYKMFEDYEFIVNAFEKIIQRGIESGEFRKVNARLIAENILLVMQAWALKRWLLKKDFTLAEYVTQQTDYILDLLKNLGKC